MFWILVGFALGVFLVKAQPKIDRWHNRKIQRHVLEARLSELRNGRENHDLTVKIDPVS